MEKDRADREFTRMKGQVSFYTNKDKEVDTVPGPYKKIKRLDLLEKLLIAERQMNLQLSSEKSGDHIKLITHEELEEIRTSPPANCSVGSVDDNIYKWQATIMGHVGSPYEG